MVLPMATEYLLSFLCCIVAIQVLIIYELRQQYDLVVDQEKQMKSLMMEMKFEYKREFKGLEADYRKELKEHLSIIEKHVYSDECSSKPCQYGGTCVDGVGNYICLCKWGFAGQNCEVSKACHELYDFGLRDNRVYTIDPDIQRSFNVYCELDDNSPGDGGWTVFQRRVDGTVNFDRPRVAYEQGFGDMAGNFWLGLTYLARLTAAKDTMLRIDLKDDKGTWWYAEYAEFHVADVTDAYRLHVGNYKGTAVNALFGGGSTIRVNGIERSFLNCPRHHDIDWWYSDCFWVNLNLSYDNSIFKWPREAGFQIKTTVMKLKRRK